MQSVAVIGGGFTGSLLAIRLAEAGADVILIDPAGDPGAGLAYGRARAPHFLNAPAERMEIGLKPAFTDWLEAWKAQTRTGVGEAGRMAHAYAPRILFGLYMQERLGEALARGPIRHVRGFVESIQVSENKVISLILRDGRRLAADQVVLAIGNAPPRIPVFGARPGSQMQDWAGFIPDPWATGALEGISPDASVLLIGTGLTAVDVALDLHARGHKGPLHLWSRHGRLPAEHREGGRWSPFLRSYVGSSPLKVMRVIRAQIMAADRQNIVWQRVIDAARPDIAAIWRGWSQKQCAQFLRHGRSLWETQRHRMAPRVAERLAAMRAAGQLHLYAGRLANFDLQLDGALEVRLHAPRREACRLIAHHAVVCTGPETDPIHMGGVVADLMRQGLARSDPLGLGLETLDDAVLDHNGAPSSWLFAAGGLTRPEWWEITAAPEIAAQVSLLANRLLRRSRSLPQLSDMFADFGAGI